MRMPRVTCPRCGRRIAAGPVSGRPGWGRIVRHDEPGMHREYRGALVSCPGSLEVLPLPGGTRQLDLLDLLHDVEDQDNAHPGDTLF